MTRPRVEGEAKPPICRGCGDEFDNEALCWVCARDLESEVSRLTAEVERLTKDYNELIYAVGNRYRDETRHQTALRYIQQAEGRDSVAGQATAAPPAPEGTDG